MNKKMILVSGLVVGLSAASAVCYAGWFDRIKAHATKIWNDHLKGPVTSALHEAAGQGKAMLQQHGEEIATHIVGHVQEAVAGVAAHHGL
ncbi:MAG: hypothetical protein LBJ03_02610 [Holosporales bacterium]|jgi:hypothetical protein|nr:hypothetical protein [Holosporales bacterium]